jgi:Lsr2
MAQKVTVVLEEDLTGGPAQQTVRLAVDGTDYETGLSAKNAAASGQPARAPHCGSMNCPLPAITPSAMAAGLRLRPRVLAPAPTER